VAAAEGTRSYGFAPARALGRPGCWCSRPSSPPALTVVGEARPIDAHLAVLLALRLNPAPDPACAVGDPEALRTLLSARAELVTTSNGQINRLKGCCATATTTRLPAASSPAPT
jgi:hypothetical protein